MQLRYFKVTLVVLLLAAAIMVQAALPPGSYIRKPVHNERQLIQHMKTDAVVRDRYVRHFRMTPQQLEKYFSTLHVAKLTRDGAYTVFNAHEDGVLRARVFQLKKGTLVLADENHRPIMKLVCGNPMVYEIPPVGSEPGTTTTLQLRDGETETSFIAQNLIEEPRVSEVVETPVPPIPPVAETPVITTRGDNNYGALLLLGGLGLLFTDGGDEPPPVPEPATMLVLAAGAGYIAARKRKK
jgi:hypothetical protein